MKRNENLIPLSRDHHFGLLCSWKIREGIKKNISYERIKRYINYFWEHYLSTHFDLEDHILPKTNDAILSKKMEQEHKEIQKLISSINRSDDVKLLESFALTLQNHIRFEERVCFPNYENQLSEEELFQIGEALKDQHIVLEDAYDDEFWK